MYTDLEEDNAKNIFQRYRELAEDKPFPDGPDFRYWITENGSGPVVYEVSRLDDGIRATYSARRALVSEENVVEGLVDNEKYNEEIEEWFEELKNYSNSSR